MKDYTNRDQHNYSNMDIAATAYPKFVEKLDVCRDLMYGFDYRKLIFTNSREALADAIAEGKPIGCLSRSVMKIPKTSSSNAN